MRSRLLTLVIVIVTAITHANAAPVDDAAAARRADQFKAAYLFNFLKFVEWPNSVPTDTLTVCFVGAHSVYEALSTGIEDKRVGTRRLYVRQVTGATFEGCNILYIDSAASARPTLPDTPTLTVSDAKTFTQNGGMIELFTDNNRLRFIINADNAQKAGLRISSDLLKLAASVTRDQR